MQHRTPMRTPPAPAPARPPVAREHLDEDALVDLQGDQSFPASDPPSWTLGPDQEPRESAG